MPRHRKRHDGLTALVDLIGRGERRDLRARGNGGQPGRRVQAADPVIQDTRTWLLRMTSE